MEFDSVFTVKKEFSKDDFMRQLLVELGTKSNTPVDVVDAEFKEVTESVKEVIVCSASVEGNCTASVGYDRQEPYTDYETYREKVGDSYVTRQRAVTKFRTVTDWKIFQTEYSGNATCAALNSDETTMDNSRIVNAIKSADTDSIVAKGDATVNSVGLREVLSTCETNVEISAVNFPGDHHKDTQYHSTSEIQSLSCYKLPFYEVIYTYKGKNYTASSFACGNINIYATTPPIDIDITTVVQEKTACFEKTKKQSWTLFVISLIVASILCIALKFAWLFFIPILLLIKTKKDHDTYEREYKNCSDSFSKNISQSKLSALQKSLEKHGYEPLSQNFSQSFEDAASIPGAKKLPSVKNRFVWSWVLTVIMTIVSVFTLYSSYKKYMHSPKQVDVHVLSMETEYDPNASGYISGCYYIRFEYEITAKKTGIDYIDVRLNIKDKKGNELGYLTSSLSNINADPGDKKIMVITWEENQPESNEFFTQVYNADFSELQFSYEIGAIQFSDGEYYYGDYDD